MMLAPPCWKKELTIIMKEKEKENEKREEREKKREKEPQDGFSSSEPCAITKAHGP